MKGNVGCALHMFLTTPLPKFINSLVKEHLVIATRKSTLTGEPYEEFSHKTAKQNYVHRLL